MLHTSSPVRLDWVDPSVCSWDYRLKIISRLPFFNHLPPKAISEINALFRERGVERNEHIYFEGDEAGTLYLVARGKIKLVRDTASGREVLLDILHGGEYFGTLTIFGEHAYTETAIAQTDGCLLQISSADFERILAEHPEVTRNVLEAVSKRLTESQEIIKQLSAYTVEQRVASALVRLARKLGEKRNQGILIQTPFSRQELAAMTGSTTETVSRIMRRLAEQGVIKTGRKWVTLMDMPRLEKLAEQYEVN